MWVVYFNIGAERASRRDLGLADPGRLARSGYTYMHILMVAGIIVAAVADELALHHPGGHTDLKTAAVILGGPALYLAGNSLFKWLTAPWGRSRTRSGSACSPPDPRGAVPAAARALRRRDRGADPSGGLGMGVARTARGPSAGRALNLVPGR